MDDASARSAVATSSWSRRLIIFLKKETEPDCSGPASFIDYLRRSRLALRLQRKISRRCGAVFDTDLLIVGAEFFLPHFDGVITRRHVRDRVVALVVRHRVVRRVGRDPP